MLVSAAHRCAYAGLLLLGAALTGVTVLIFATVSSPTIGLIAGASTLILFSAFWVLLPLAMRTWFDNQ